MTMRKVESGFANVKIDKFGKQSIVYTHYAAPEKFSFYISFPEGADLSKGLQVSAYRGDMNEFDAKDLMKRKEFLEKSKERAASGGGETKGPVTRPVARKEAPVDVDDESIIF